MVGDGGVDLNRVRGAADGGGGFAEEDGRGGHCRAVFGGVVGVVAAHAEDILARARDGREQMHVCQVMRRVLALEDGAARDGQRLPQPRQTFRAQVDQAEHIGYLRESDQRRHVENLFAQDDAGARAIVGAIGC